MDVQIAFEFAFNTWHVEMSTSTFVDDIIRLALQVALVFRVRALVVLKRYGVLRGTFTVRSW